MNKDEVFFTEFKKDDFEEIQCLWDLTNMGNPERADNALTIVKCNQNGGRLILLRLKTSNEIIGTSWLTNDGRRTSIHHFCVKPNYQRQGFGILLGEESLKHIKEIGSQVRLEVHKKNYIAKKLYEKLGFFAFVDYDIYMIRDIEKIKTSS